MNFETFGRLVVRHWAKQMTKEQLAWEAVHCAEIIILTKDEDFIRGLEARQAIILDEIRNREGERRSA